MPDVTINFRATASFVTDGDNEGYELADTTVRSLNGYSWAWDASASAYLGANDRNSSETFAPELSGLNYLEPIHTGDFLVTLPTSGTYNVGIAIGDASYGFNGNTCRIYDDTTLLLAVCTDATNDWGNFLDITGVQRTPAQWKAERATTPLAFTSTTLRVRIGGGSGNLSTIASLIVQFVSASSSDLVGVGIDSTVIGPGALSASAALVGVGIVSTVVGPGTLTASAPGVTGLVGVGVASTAIGSGTLSDTLMALTLANTAVATSVTSNTTTTGVSVADGYVKDLCVSIDQVGAATTAATWCGQVSVDGGATYYDYSGTAQSGIAAGTAAATYSWVVQLPPTSTHVRIVFVQQAGGTSSTLNAVVGKVTAL